jgi:Asp-tRNA(Asn)/Glu-tRNA(Gln) amidotransferase A subunit family amidase
MPASEWDYCTTKELGRVLEARKISASELLERTIERIEVLDKQLNAVVVRDFEGAREAHPYNDAFYVWADPATTCGLPATAAPIDHTAGNLPVGIQIIGPFLEDRTTIAFAELIEREFGGFVPPPGYAE